MKTIYQSLLFALALAGTAYAQVPAGNDTSDPNHNTGTGSLTLGGPAGSNGGGANTASGYQALRNNTTGSSNTAAGVNALFYNTTGIQNTAAGVQALFYNMTGGYNTATGVQALYENTTGADNTATGLQALFSNTIGGYNTAAGAGALYSNTFGGDNTAAGSNALYFNTGGNGNTAAGYEALLENTNGVENTAVGLGALLFNTIGGNNIGVGYQAGANLTTGFYNIDIGSAGVAGEGNTIRIGTSQTAAYIAGFSTAISGTLNTLMISSTGQIGVKASSARYKKDITPMGSNSEKLQQLRPVTFHYKSDATGNLEYGLIAEEVAKVYPELVIRSESGRIEGVRYDELAPILVNEAQKQAAKIRGLEQQVSDMHAALLRMQGKGAFEPER